MNINKGIEFSITKLNAATGWHQVYYNGYLGYVYAPNVYIKASSSQATATGKAIRTDGTPVYNTTLSGGRVMGTLTSGTEIKVIQKNAASGWHKIYYNGFEGYVKASESAIKTSAPATVATAEPCLGWAGLYNATGSTRYVITNINKGTKFNITKLNAATGWHQVYYDGYLGYVYAPNVYIKASSSQVTATGIVIQSGGSALYNTTISGKRVMTTLPRYTELKIIKKNSPSGWHKVYYNGFEGYIPSSYTAVRVSSKPTITTTGKLKYQSGLYNNTGSGNKIIWSIAAGTKVEIIQANYISGWHQVYYDGFVGYIKTSNVTLSSSMMDRFRAALTVLDTESEKSAVHVRKSPSTSAESLGLIYGQTVGVTVIENYSNGWSKIKGITYANKSVTGYVKTMYLKQVFPNTAMSVHIDIAKQRLYIYDKNGNLIRSMKCSTGTAGNDTPTGDYLIGGRKPYFISGLMTAEKAVRFNGGIYIHRVPYYTDRPGSYDRAISQLGKKASHGCVRVPIADSTWIYDNLPKGSKVVVTD